MNKKSESILLHEKLKGKIEMISRVKISDAHDLSVVYSPGVADPCLEIQKDNKLSYKYTRRHNMIAVITDGSAVLGLGNIGPEAAMPVMEGKSILFKTLGDVDAIPLCLRTQDTNEIIQTISLLAGNFGGINLEDISAPRCFEIEDELKKICDIPIFHDDQHGTAIVIGAALINALKLVIKEIHNIRVVINGAGAAGTATAEYLLLMGVQDLIVCDRFGILSSDDESLSMVHQKLAKKTNIKKLKGNLSDAIKNSDVFIGVSVANCVSREMIASMNEKSIVFAMANPIPEISVEDAKMAGAYIVGTGSSNYPNQINNLLAFPGIFRGTLDAHAKEITIKMMLAASLAIAKMVDEKMLCRDYIVPNSLDKDVHTEVAKYVCQAAIDHKVAKTHE
ncbi:MAG: NADP-dependent malic enzyme [Firmicutes bacterium]|nr:NADP-dependent malic enzyme [Bacillota bacterium]